HEGGTPNLLGATALAAACDALDATDAAVLQQHEQALVQRLRSGLSALPRVRLPRIWADSTEGVGIVAFTVDGIAPADVAAYLSAVHGIGVRDGRFCAHPLLARLNLPAAVRASVGLGSCTADVDRLVAAVAELPA
ncbi:MAG: aminotransferase class V-fold PLP-dependent enzyme, partial [Mycobacteriaceae bacterium]|nr:aminotransferase class V-fold PLP-dependent enzyme [Mycobacteriaceae bacterium]